MIKTPKIKRRKIILVGVFFLAFLLIFFLAKQIFFSKTEILEENERTNILVLGVGGEGHQGKNLSDTIILASIGLDTKDVVLISIPRDLWVPALNAKINTAYEIGQEKGDGLDFVKETVYGISGVPIHYIVKIDFSGFVKGVDLLGGIDVEVDRTFDDYFYPIPGEEENTCGYEIKEEEKPWGNVTIFLDATGGAVSEEEATSCRFEHLHFEKGLVHMDGETALKFVRSRMAEGDEGTDFARSERQQKVITAAKDKFFSLETLANPAKVIQIAGTLGGSLEEDIPNVLAPKFLSLAKEIPSRNIKSYVINDEEDGILINPPKDQYFGQWVLIPKNNDYRILTTNIQKMIYPEEVKLEQ